MASSARPEDEMAALMFRRRGGAASRNARVKDSARSERKLNNARAYFGNAILLDIPFNVLD